MWIWISSSSSSLSSSSHTDDTDFRETLSSSVPDIHFYGQAFQTTSYIHSADVTYVLAGRLSLPHSCVLVHSWISLMIAYLLLQSCHTCFINLTRMVVKMGGKKQYSCFFLGFFLTGFGQNSSLCSSSWVVPIKLFFSLLFVIVHVVDL